MNTVALVFVSEVKNDKNGKPLKWGRTADYISGDVYHPGQIITCYNEDLFDQFVVGLKVAL